MSSTVERYVWRANKQGNQLAGNRQEIRPLTESLYRRWIKPLLRPEWPALADYQRTFPHQTHINLITRGDGAVILGQPSSGPLAALRPQPSVSHWALRVATFDSPEALAWSRTADSDVDAPPPTRGARIRHRAQRAPHQRTAVGTGLAFEAPW